MRRSAASLGLWMAYCAFVVYGSLVPLDYRALPFDTAWQYFQNIPYLRLGIESRADWVANGVLYLPLGYLTANLLMRMLGRALRGPALLLACMFCGMLAVGVEFTQLYFPPRSVSLNDLVAEAIGIVLGVAVAPFLLPWLHRFQARWWHGGRELGVHLLEAYCVAYLLLCLFPYDLLLSLPELRSKVESEMWGWWLSGVAMRPVLVTLQLGLEVALALPFGWLLARRGSRTSLLDGVAMGLLLGMGIEAGQFLIASGISQGASIFSRAVGVMLGVALWRSREHFGLEQASAQVRRHALAYSAVYAVLLAVVNGWFHYPWQGFGAAMAQWHGLRLMPFYYHYYTSEAQALFSLGSVALMYLPVAALGWAFCWSTATSLTMAVTLCGLVEISKLFLAGAHPDPTNLLIATGACALALTTLALAGRKQLPATLPQNAAAQTLAGSALDAARDDDYPGRAPMAMLALPGLALAALSSALFPAFALWLMLLLLVCAAAVWWRPVLALAVIPAALPILDLAPWSGRLFWDEFDLLMLTCLSVAAWRAAPARDARKQAPSTGSGSTLAFALLAISLGLSAALGALPLRWPDANSFTGYYSPFNALRIAKGALWAWVFVWLYRRLATAQTTSGGWTPARMFVLGMNAGLALTVAAVAWERTAFVGLFDFAADYRVTGPFSAMHKGGAYIECYLAVASAFALVSVLQARTWAPRVLGGLLMLGAIYALAVTYSRNGYAAMALVLGVVLGGSLMPSFGRGRRALLALLMLGAVLGMAAPILTGEFARERMASVADDLAVRRAHWADALQLRDPGWATELFGMGLGRFPESHFWRSKEPLHAGSYRLEQEAGNAFLRLGAGASIYVEQIVDLTPGQDVVLSARLRSNKAAGAVGLALCQKWLLTSARCVTAVLASGPKPGAWQRVEVRLNSAALTEQPAWLRRPLKLAMVTPSPGLSVDIDDVRLETGAQLNLLANGDFGAGLDRWFFATDVHPPWQIDSLPLAILFDQGWLGVVAWSMLLVVALVNGTRRVLSGSSMALAALAALLGFLVSGSLNTLIDAPRFLWLLLVLSWLCATGSVRRSTAHRVWDTAPVIAPAKTPPCPTSPSRASTSFTATPN